MVYAFLGLIVVIIDQYSKYMVTQNIPLAGPKTIIDGILSITYALNSGAAFSMFKNGRIGFIILTGAVVLLVIIAIAANWIKKPWGRLAAAMVAAGGCGNLIDRVVYGQVVDFIQLDFVNFPIFNIADIFVTVFAIVFCIYILIGDKIGKDADYDEDEDYDDDEDEYDDDDYYDDDDEEEYDEDDEEDEDDEPVRKKKSIFGKGRKNKKKYDDEDEDEDDEESEEYDEDEYDEDEEDDEPVKKKKSLFGKFRRNRRDEDDEDEYDEEDEDEYEEEEEEDEPPVKKGRKSIFAGRRYEDEDDEDEDDYDEEDEDYTPVTTKAVAAMNKKLNASTKKAEQKPAKQEQKPAKAEQKPAKQEQKPAKQSRKAPVIEEEEEEFIPPKAKPQSKPKAKPAYVEEEPEEDPFAAWESANKRKTTAANQRKADPIPEIMKAEEKESYYEPPKQEAVPAQESRPQPRSESVQQTRQAQPAPEQPAQPARRPAYDEEEYEPVRKKPARKPEPIPTFSADDFNLDDILNEFR